MSSILLFLSLAASGSEHPAKVTSHELEGYFYYREFSIPLAKPSQVELGLSLCERHLTRILTSEPAIRDRVLLRECTVVGDRGKEESILAEAAVFSQEDPLPALSKKYKFEETPAIMFMLLPAWLTGELYEGHPMRASLFTTSTEKTAKALARACQSALDDERLEVFQEMTSRGHVLEFQAWTDDSCQSTKYLAGPDWGQVTGGAYFMVLSR